MSDTPMDDRIMAAALALAVGAVLHAVLSSAIVSLALIAAGIVLLAFMAVHRR